MSANVIASVSELQIGAVILALLILLLAALTGAKIAEVCGIPKVAGEILGGLAIGPTLFGFFFPTTYGDVFNSFASEGQILSAFSWLGLILLMFTSGYEADLKGIGKDGRLIGWLIAGSTVLPLAAGYWVSDGWFAVRYLGEAGNVTVFNIVFATATAVTSIPVISKIFLDLGLINHRFARVVLASATIQDLFLWVLLSIAGSLLDGEGFSPAGLALHVGITAALFAFAMLLVPRLGRWRGLERLAVFSYDSIYFILCFSFVWLGTLFGVNIMYSAFVAGLVFRNIGGTGAVEAQKKIRDLCLAFFTPVYFAVVGLRIHLTADFGIGWFAAFLFIVSAIELAGCLAAMRLIRVDWLTGFNLGVAMNARGGPGIVLATVTREMGIINDEFFCVLVLTTIVTSTAAGWWIGYIHKKGELMRHDNPEL